MQDYVSGNGTIRTIKYALRDLMQFPHLKTTYGRYIVYDNEDSSYYEFCLNAFLGKYGRADDFYNNKRTLEANEERYTERI